jgi:hypothetical protein
MISFVGKTPATVFKLRTHLCSLTQSVYENEEARLELEGLEQVVGGMVELQDGDVLRRHAEQGCHLYVHAHWD